MDWKIRPESFGGILFSEKLGMTVFVDKDYMKFLGEKESKLWNQEKNYLSAPLFVHFNFTNQCPKQCPFCYSDSKPEGNRRLSFKEIKKIIDILSEMKVFSVAFGGGEPFSRPDIFAIAAYAREKGISPTVTTNGMFITRENVKKCKVFSVIHVSVDLFNEKLPFEEKSWHKALQLLKKEKIRVGINFIVNKKSYSHLEEICKYAKKMGIKDVLFLRFKPMGRGKSLYSQLKLSHQEYINFFSLLRKLAKKYKIHPMIDCSFLPMAYWSGAKKEILNFFGYDGCVGGNYFAAIDHLGNVKSCSFWGEPAGKAEKIRFFWENSSQFNFFREWIKNPPSPCKECPFLLNCRGGCHAVAKEIMGNAFFPDPECPFVVEYNKNKCFLSSEKF